MRPSVRRRILKEFDELRRSPPEGFELCFDESQIQSELIGYFIGPKDTPQEGGLFTFTLAYPEEYPFKPPRFRFRTPVFHPAINNSGNVCVDILRDQWSPALTTAKVLLSVRQVFLEPDFANPLNSEATRANIQGTYNQEAEIFTLQHAH